MSENENRAEKKVKNRAFQFAAIGVVLIALILVVGSLWMGRSARESTEEAVHTVSLFYLNELADRREQVVASNLENNIKNIQNGISLMNDGDLDSIEHLQDYQARMKQLYDLDKFAFVDEKGTIYTSQGTQSDIDSYPFDYQTISAPEIAVKDLNSPKKTVIIAMPLEQPLIVEKHRLTVCFMEINMNVMLKGVSMQDSERSVTFCNIYSKEGIPLTNQVLGGLADESNLMDALNHVSFDTGYSAEKVTEDFDSGTKGVSTFTYEGVRMTLYYVPVEQTDLMLTYMVRENLIGKQIQSVSNGIIRRSILQTLLTALVLAILFILMALQTRRSSRLIIEKEKSEAESRALEQQLALQAQLLEQEKKHAQLNSMINALTSNYTSVYYVDLDEDRGVCYRSDAQIESAPEEEQSFPYLETFRDYANRYIDESFREDFLEFIRPDSIRDALSREKIISYRYLVHREEGRESYEMIRMASVGHASAKKDQKLHAVGISFANVDRETRDAMMKNKTLSEALQTAEEASKAKTAFLSNMSHEIRTPMNAIIGLDTIVLSDPELSETTRDHVEKIDSSARHLLNLINDILDMSRIESGRMVLKNEDFSFSHMLEQINTIISGQCSEKNLTYECRIEGEIDDHYVGDDMKLRQIIINILGNAVKFTPEGGNITFTIERTARFQGKSTLLLTMSDTGIGMDPEFLPRLFDAFSQEDSSSTNRFGSSGLGMAITKNLVEMMNGQINVESEKGVGSTFHVTVTLTDSAVQESVDDDEMIDLHEMCVLIIDDDPVACEHARLVLENAGISAEVAASGSDAIEMVRLRSARRDPYNLILVDWKMPEMDGVETTRRIREITGDASAIIILTAYRWDDILEEALEAGVDSFLSKPLFAGSIIEEFQKASVKKRAVAADKIHKADLAGRRILLAEDVAINAEIIIMLLNMNKMEVDHAENGRIAVDKFQAHEAGYYDAILMDMRMPEMDGLTATRMIRAMDRPDASEIPIIALTANAFDSDVQKSLTAGLNAHLSKPVEPDNLIGTLQNLIKD